MPPDPPGTGDGAYVDGPNIIKYRFGDTDIAMPGTYEFSAAQVNSGPIESITVTKSGNPAWALTDFVLNIEDLWADAGDNGRLDTVPAEIFKDDDTLNGSASKDILFGFAGDDVIRGGKGADRVNGGKGEDDLFGGRGADVFVFRKVSDSRDKPGALDTIHDFKRKDGDMIDLSDIDAKSGVGGNQKFKFIGEKGFHDHKGELRYKAKGGDVYLQGDVNGDGKADFTVHIEHLSKLKAADFDL